MNRETKQRTFYTLQFYLPSDTSGSKESFVPAQGGTTRFSTRYSSKNYADVEAIPGRVLVFQHADLYHTGEEVGRRFGLHRNLQLRSLMFSEQVTGGIKCTVRSDILYERVGEPIAVEKK
jgi:hypothetical protein